ncbi:MAG: Ig-like domain-containing protein [Acidobacteriota bacterium]
MSPLRGVAVQGRKISFGGSSFPPGLRIDIDGAQIASTQVISPQLAEVTLGADFTIQGTTRLRFRDQDNRDLPDKFVYPAILAPASPNSPPLAVTDEAETPESLPVLIEVLSNDSDPEGDPLSLVSVTQPSNGTAQIASQTAVTYTPADGFQGSDSFSYTVADSKGAEATGTVNVNVLPGLLQFAVPDLSMIRGTAESVALNLGREAPAGSILQLSAAPQGILQLPGPILLQPGDSSLNLTVFATTAGEAVLTATAGNESAALSIQALEGTVVEVPVLENRAEAQMGLAITNRSDAGAQVRLRAFAEEQDPPQPGPLGLGAPLEFAVSLEPLTQISRLLSEYDPRLDGFRGWIELSSTNTALAAMFLNLTGARGGFAGASSSPRAEAFAFPQSLVNPDGDFEFTLVNNNGQPAEVQLSWRGSAAVGAEVRLTLPPQQSLIRSLREVFPALSQQDLSAGYLVAESSEPLSAYQQRATAVHLLGQRPPALSGAASLLFLPHIVAGPDWFTEVSLINPGEVAAQAVLRLVDDASVPVSDFAAENPVRVVLQPHQQLVALLGDLFGWTATEIRPGSLVIESTAPLLGAAVIGRDSPLGPTAIVPLLASPFSAAVFAQAASGELDGIRLFTGLAFQNPQPRPVNVAVQVFSQQGVLVGEGQIELQSAERRSRLLSEIVPGLEAFASGYLVVQASEPVLMLEIFGDSQLAFLSTVDASIQ